MKIVPNEDIGFVVDDKRFYLPFKLVGICPVCGDEFERDFNTTYLSYPMANEIQMVDVWHFNEEKLMDCEFEVPLYLTIRLDVADV